MPKMEIYNISGPFEDTLCISVPGLLDLQNIMMYDLRVGFNNLTTPQSGCFCSNNSFFTKFFYLTFSYFFVGDIFSKCKLAAYAMLAKWEERGKTSHYLTVILGNAQ